MLYPAPVPGTWVPVRPGENVRHVVPQRLRREASEVELQFRARRPIEAATRALVRIDDGAGSCAVVASRRLRYTRPSEMVSVALGPDALAQLGSAQEVTVHLVATDEGTHEDG